MASKSHSTSLTAHLLSTQRAAYTSATRHPFLTKSGAGMLADSVVCKWLVQDKYYQFGYVSFIGSLLSKLDLSHLAQSNAKIGNKEVQNDDGQSLLRATMDVLIDSLSAIRQEIDFYDQTAKKYDLALEPAEMSGVTREYVELFKEAGKEYKGLLHGLVILWATEHVGSAFSFYNDFNLPSSSSRVTG